MYLKELELYNFKSFAGCHRISFSSNFIVITGPNGSGKSNILDAIRWVFGEQRTKLLRAERSDEIIFGGNKILPPSKYTQVFITLSIPQENNIYQEFIISRKFSIEGESEYFLNDNNVRLKDLLLFLYSNGIGKHSFLFIGQGEIDFLITNNGERLKSFIEDIAGISGYEEKVKETQIRLEIIESKWKELEEKRLNLLKNLELLRKEAKTAEIYNKLSQELKNIRESLIFYQWQRIKRNIDEYYKKIIEKEENLKILENNLNILENQLLEIKRKKEEYNKTLNEKVDIFYKTKDLYLDYQRKIDISSQKLLNLRDKKESLKIELNKVEKELSSIDEELYFCDNYLSKEKDNEIDLLEKDLKEKEKQFKEKSLLKIKYEENLRSISNFLNDSKDSLKVKLKNLDEISKRLILKINIYKERKKKLEEYSVKLLREIREKEGYIRSKERYLEEIKFEYQKERKLLRELEELQEESYPKGVREIMKLNDKEVLGLVMDIIEVKKDYLTAIYNILGNSLFDIIVEDEYTAERLIKYLREKNLGWATFRPLTFYKDYKIKEISKRDGEWALNVVSFSPEYKLLIYNLLGNVLIFENFETAIKELNLLKEGFRFSTLKGEVFSGSGTISGGIRHNIQTALNIIKTKQDKEDKIKDLEQSILFIEKDIEILKNDKKALFMKRDKTEKIIRIIDDKIKSLEDNYKEYELEKEKLDFFLKEGENILKNIEILNLEIKNLERTIETIRRRFEEIKGEHIFLKEKRKFLLNRKDIFEKRKKEIIIEKDCLESEISNHEEDLKILELKRIELFEKIKNLEILLKDKEQEKKKIEDIEENLKRDWQDIRDKIIIERTTLDEIKKRREELEKDLEERFENEPNLKINLSENKLKLREKEILKEIENLGPINFLAEEKLNIEEKKYNDLTEELKDIYSSILSLRKIIRDTRKEAEIKFLNTYENLKNSANENWRLFFPHGELNLILSNFENPLDSEIFIKLSSNKKNYKSILTLSGGEKSITSLSLLLAGLEITPVKFCFWDEIDSALDSHNAEILGRKLRDMSKNIQFILISHNPIIMEYSNTLYGVILNEKGHSQVISYNLEGEKVI